jgi:rhodanese-related sulfurtransferase
MIGFKSFVGLIMAVVVLSIGLASTSGCSSGTTSSTDISSTQELTIELPGTDSYTIFTDNQGRLLKNAQLTSSDGSISLAIDKGTTLLDEGGKPLQFMKVEIDTAIPPVPPKIAARGGASVEIQPPRFGASVEIQPQGAIANPSLKLTLNYDPSALPQGTSENDVRIVNYGGGTLEVMSYKQVDTEAHRITTTITHFGKYAVFAPTKPVEITPPKGNDNSAKTELTAKELASKIASGEKLVIIDVNPLAQFKEGHIQGAIQGDLNSLRRTTETYLNQLGVKKTDTIVLVCETGSRSAITLPYLVKAGYSTVYNLKDGNLAWLRAGFTLTQE